MAGRTTVDTPLIGWVLALNDGMMVRSWSFRSPAPWLTRSVADSTSTGTADSVALRGCAREPTTTVSSVKPAIRLRISSGDSPRASISSGVIPSARPSSSASGSVRSSTGSCVSLSCGSAAAPAAGNVNTGPSIASVSTNRRHMSPVRDSGPVIVGVVHRVFRHDVMQSDCSLPYIRLALSCRLSAGICR